MGGPDDVTEGTPESPGSVDAPADPAPGDGEQEALDLAARRRAALSRTPAEHPAGEPAARADGTVVTDRATVDAAAQSGSPVRPAGGVWQGRPVVLSTQPGAPGGVRPGASDYVTAEFTAVESTVMPGCTTPVSRKLWNAGMLVRRDVYEAVRVEHERRVADGTERVAQPARLPADVERTPPEVVGTGPGAGVVTDDTATGGAGLSAGTAEGPGGAGVIA